MQKRSIEALAAMQSAQLTSLETSREFAQQLTNVTTPIPSPALMVNVTELTASYAWRILDEQLAYAKRITEIFVPPAVADAAPATLAIAPVALAAAPTAETPIRESAPIESAPIESAPIECAAIESAPIETPAIASVPAEAEALQPDAVASTVFADAGASEPAAAAAAPEAIDENTAPAFPSQPPPIVETIIGDVIEKMASKPSTGMTAMPTSKSPKSSNNRALPPAKRKK